MRIPFFYFFGGYYRVQVDARQDTRLKNLIYVARIPACPLENGAFLIPHKEKKRLLSFAKKERVSLTVSEIQGLPQLFVTYKYRFGLPLGALLATILIFFGTNTVWQVEISGVQTLSPAAIEENLSALGFGVGTFKDDVNYEELSLSYRLAHPEIAWMGIYTEGTTAHVKVIENRRSAEEATTDVPSHLIATEDALIIETDVLHGTLCVGAGEVVKKGDILALGLLKGVNGDTFLCAQGSVTGRVSKTFSVAVPTSEVIKTEKTRKKVAFNIIFFEKVINIFKNTSKNASDYVIINRKEQFFLPNGRPLPFGVSYEEALLYEEAEIPLSEEEGMRSALAEMDALIRAQVGDGILLSRQIKTETVDGVCTLYATVEYTKNIAEACPIVLAPR